MACISHSMDLHEQTPPNKPKFKLVVILFAVAIVVILVLAIFYLRNGEKHLTPDGRPSPQSSMMSNAVKRTAQS